MPAFLVHGWMPDAYRVAPLPALAVFSAVLSKVAAYGFLRVVLPLFPDATIEFQEVMMLIALASILYGSVMAFTQTNARLIAGYSSVAQLGFITLGIFTLRPDGADGAVLQMVNHGLVVAPLLLILVVLVERAGTTTSPAWAASPARAPVLAAMFLIVTMALLAIPGSSNFIGEIYILFGAFETKIVIALIAFAGVAMAGYYALRLYQRTMHNRLPPDVESREIPLREGAIIGALVACIVALALYPNFILHAHRRLRDHAAHRGGERPLPRRSRAGERVHRTRDRLRRPLAADRADRGALRGAAGRAAARRRPLLGRRADAGLARRRRRHWRSGSGASARTSSPARCASTSWGWRPR